MGKLWNELSGLYESVAPAALKRKLEEKNPDFQGAWANFGMSYQGFTRAWRLQEKNPDFQGAWANFEMSYQGFTRAWRLQRSKESWKKRIQTFKAHGQTLE